jgi:two-component system response regulator HydG
VVLEDPFASGQHLSIRPDLGQFRVTDLHSTNGTYLGAVRLLEAEVPLGTSLRLGETEVVIERDSPEPEADSRQGIIGEHPCISRLIDLIARIAPSSAAVAVFGESGTGKELVARAIHSRSARSGGPFVPLNCAAISRALAESELFGHEKGAFTGASSAKKGAFEEADGGTLFLDEVGELPLELQATLLRALESGEVKRVGATRSTHVDVRLLTATNVDLYKAVREGRFREDLYYRLCVVPVHVPPLRAHLSDLPALAEYFLKTFSPAGSPAQLSGKAHARLQAHSWPGNVRELRNVIERALLLRKGGFIEAEDVVFDEAQEAHGGFVVGRSSLVGSGATNDKRRTMNPVSTTLEEAIDALERELVDAALKRHGGNRERAAKELGLARSSLFKRLREWGLTGRGEDA